MQSDLFAIASERDIIVHTAQCSLGARLCSQIDMRRVLRPSEGRQHSASAADKTKNNKQLDNYSHLKGTKDKPSHQSSTRTRMLSNILRVDDLVKRDLAIVMWVFVWQR